MGDRKRYEVPVLIEYGSIADCTLGNAGGCTGGETPSGNCPPKDTNVCHLDKFAEYSCS